MYPSNLNHPLARSVAGVGGVPNHPALSEGDEIGRGSRQCGHATRVAIFHPTATWRNTLQIRALRGEAPDPAENMVGVVLLGICNSSVSEGSSGFVGGYALLDLEKYWAFDFSLEKNDFQKLLR
ncbi:hypothetical protein CEXT_348781 [Caerostris extrusa]|uniref:Uncharacterized protein n=1 Tax=Caerostris extrusa TaxID=172846 RepID=A0AAV4XQM2_CAEEX|nr:hypothetical protein CEXT_348781 [Caerostris extrusa]